MGDRLGDQCGRCRHVTLFEPEQSEAWMRAPHVAVRLEERLLGSLQVATPQADRAQLHQGPAELPSHPGPELGAGGERLLLRPVAGSGHAEHLGPMDPAPSADPADGVAGTPSGHDLGPLHGSVVEGEPLRRADELAVHHPGGEWIDLAGHQQHGDLVEVLDPAFEVAVEDPDTGTGDPADHDGGEHAEPFAEPDGECRLRACAVEVAAEEP
ncbi:MAG: hypothetical protein MUE34_15330, partial [Acidimicrobiales bacterium]|nr:hypothetical protein [Acidimicrobiales bacterium]